MAQEYITLAAGNKMPVVGLGTWAGQMQAGEEEEVRKAVEAALDSGYKLIDTAYYYRNEHVIGQVIKERIAKGSMKREDVFITTKLGMISLGSRERVQECINLCLKHLGMDYVDLFLIHFPIALKYYGPENLWPMTAEGMIEMDHADIVKCWQYMEEVVDQGKAKAIGVSNFSKEQIDRIRKVARIPISNQQVELNAYFQQKDLAKFCQERNISLTAYAPIGSPGSAAARVQAGADESEAAKVPMTDPLILELAKKYNKTPAQILLRNLIQRGIAVVPKSVTPSRIQSNIQVFDFKLTDGEMDAIAKIDTGKRQFAQKFMSSHPDYPFHDK